MTYLRFSVALCLGILAQGTSAQMAVPLTVKEGLGERYPDRLFLVKGPYETRGSIDLEKSEGLVLLVPGDCIAPSFKSQMGRLWFVYNNRGQRAGKRDALSLLIVKSRPINEGRNSKRVLLNAYRSSNSHWYRGGIRTFFNPNHRRPLRRTSLEQWNSAHLAGVTRAYDRLFGRRPRDRFHASPSPNPNGISSSRESHWWALPEIENAVSGEYIVEARLLGFKRAGFEQRTANGIPFFVTPGAYEKLTVKTRSDDQVERESYVFELNEC